MKPSSRLWRHGVGFMILATLFFACMKVSVKLLPRLPVGEIIAFRSCFSLIFCYLALRRQGVSPWGHHRGLLLLRGLFGGIALTLFFILIQQIPLASVYTMQYLAPVFAAIAGIWFLKERVYAVQWLFFALALGGILIVHGFDVRMNTWHLLMGISASVLMGLTFAIVRSLREKEHPLVIIFYFPVVVLPFALGTVFWGWVWPGAWEWFWLVLVGILTQSAQYCATRAAFDAKNFSKIVLVGYMGIFYAVGFGFFFGEHHAPMAYVGMLFVLASVVLDLKVSLPPQERS